MTDSEKLTYLIEKIDIMSNAIDNESPSMLLWELRRVVDQIETWEKS
jgi:hypothetical protein